VLSSLYESALHAGRPGPFHWKEGRKRFGGATLTVWSADVTSLGPREAAEVALQGRRWIEATARAA
jgi:hypothetical protein